MKARGCDTATHTGFRTVDNIPQVMSSTAVRVRTGACTACLQVRLLREQQVKDVVLQVRQVEAAIQEGLLAGLPSATRPGSRQVLAIAQGPDSDENASGKAADAWHVSATSHKSPADSLPNLVQDPQSRPARILCICGASAWRQESTLGLRHHAPELGLCMQLGKLMQGVWTTGNLAS